MAAVTVDATLASIDGALEDWGTSGDAMRWMADRVICDGGGPMMPDPYGQYRPGAIHGYRVAPMVLDPSAMPRLEFVREAMTSFALFGSAYIRAAAPAMQAFSEALNQTAEAFRHLMAVDICKAFAVPLFTSDHTHARAARCRTCNPAGNPRPLAIDGAAYRRRQQSRRRRGH